MIFCTANAKSFIKKMDANKYRVLGIEEIAELLKIDNSVGHEVRECYLIAYKDISGMAGKKKITKALAEKHESNIVIYIETRGRVKDPVDIPGINRVLTRPTVALINETIEELVTKATTNETQQLFDDQIESNSIKEEYEPQESKEFNADIFEQEPVVEHKFEEPEQIDAPIEKQYSFKEKEDGYIEKANKAHITANLAALSAEISASEVVKDLAKQNNQFRYIEDELATIRDKIYAVSIDDSLSVAEQSQKIRNLMSDKASVEASRDTMLYKRLEDIIRVMTDNSARMVAEKLSVLDRQILQNDLNEDSQTKDSLRQSLEFRTNIITELKNLDKDISEIYNNLDTTLKESVVKITEENSNVTHNPMINSQILSDSGVFVGEESLDVIGKLLNEVIPENDQKYTELLEKLRVYMEKWKTLLKYDKDIIEAQQRKEKAYQAVKIESMVTPTDLVQQAFRIFVANRNAGSAIIPYLFSKEQSAQGYNVAIINLTGSKVISNYGVKVYSLTDPSLPTEDLIYLTSDNKCTAADASFVYDRIKTLTMSYRIVNVIIDSTQTELLEALEGKYLTQTFITPSIPLEMARFKKLGTTYRYDGVPQRFIVNQTSLTKAECTSILDVSERSQVQIELVPYLDHINSASFKGTDPYYNDGVRRIFRGMV